MGDFLDGWHYLDGEDSKGPFSIEDLRALFEQQVLSDDTCVWHKSECAEWQELVAVPKLMRALKPAAPAGEASAVRPPPPPPSKRSSARGGAPRRRQSISKPTASPEEGWMAKRTLDGVAYFFNRYTEELSWDKPLALQTADERAKDAGTWVWVRDAAEGWIPAKVVADEGATVTVQSERGRTAVERHESAQPLWTFAQSELAALPDDVVMLQHINEAQIAHTLRKRFEQGQIYTWVGASRTVLISINPFRMLPLYTLDVIEEHSKPPPNRLLSPHVFDIAQGAYQSMLFTGRNQAVLISGESGAGKTEATKQCLSFLAEVAGSETCLEQRILQANPVLEAFGNAKTLRNDNSSRFGKWIETRFDQRGTICGARIENYLLEKSRVVRVAKGERSYHVFYYLFSEAAGRHMSHARPGRPQDFAFLRQSGCFTVAGLDDGREFLEVLEAMRELGFSADEIRWALDTCCALLHLGNIEFEIAQVGHESGSRVVDQAPLREAAALLRVEPPTLERAVTYRSIHIPGEGQTRIPLKPQGAADAVAALCKGVYGRLFDWLVKRVNESMAGAQGTFIGVLDIFGFEIFERNSFEQLCINYCNEKLQQHFNKHTFKEEEEVYRREGVEFVHVPFVDNQPVLDLIEGRRAGLLTLLDEEIRVPKGTDASFMAKFDQRNRDQPALVTEQKLKLSDALHFTVSHYAGEVVYHAENFLDKNRDSMWSDLHDVISDSSDPLHRALFPREDPGARRHRSLGDQFSRQLNALMRLLYDTEPRYIRCIKPNAEKAPSSFNAVMSIEQMRYSGVFEAVKIRKSGYPFRLTYRQFAFRYRCLCMMPDGTFRRLRSSDDKATVEELLSGRREDFSNIQFGATMVLYRAPEHQLLELARNLALERIVPKCQRVMRGALAREMARRLRQCTMELEEALAVGNDIELLDRAIARTAERLNTLQLLFDWEPKPLPHAKSLKEKLRVWVEVTEQLRGLRGKDASRHYTALAAAVRAGADILDVPHTEAQRALFEEARERLNTCAAAKIDPEARDALHALERGRMEAVVAEADKAAYATDDLREIRRLLALPESDFVKLQLRKAVELKDPERRMAHEIRLTELHLEANEWMFAFERYQSLRHPAEFANAKLLAFKRDAIAEGMLQFTTKPIPASLTTLPGARSKEACRAFRSVQGYMGERKLPFPAEVAHELCGKGMAEEDLRAELYCQLMKQLRENPRLPSRERGWELFALFLCTFAPPSDLEHFVHVFLRAHAEDGGRRFIQQLYRLKYEGAPAEVPSVQRIEGMLRSFFAQPVEGSRFSASGAAQRPQPPSTPTPTRTPAVSIARAEDVALDVAGSGAAAAAAAGKRYQAMFDFDATDDAMLTFKANDVLLVTDQSAKDWWVAELRGEEGYVPMNYVQALDS